MELRGLGSACLLVAQDIWVLGITCDLRTFRRFQMGGWPLQVGNEPAEDCCALSVSYQRSLCYFCSLCGVPVDREAPLLCSGLWFDSSLVYIFS